MLRGRFSGEANVLHLSTASRARLIGRHCRCRAASDGTVLCPPTSAGARSAVNAGHLVAAADRGHCSVADN